MTATAYGARLGRIFAAGLLGKLRYMAAEHFIWLDDKYEIERALAGEEPAHLAIVSRRLAEIDAAIVSKDMPPHREKDRELMRYQVARIFGQLDLQPPSDLAELEEKVNAETQTWLAAQAARSVVLPAPAWEA